MDVTREEVNGLGKRISEVELLKPEVARNQQDIQKIFDALDQIPKQNQKLVTTILFSAVISIGVATWAIVTK